MSPLAAADCLPQRRGIYQVSITHDDFGKRRFVPLPHEFTEQLSIGLCLHLTC
jgi:hypothetical protein